MYLLSSTSLAFSPPLLKIGLEPSRFYWNVAMAFQAIAVTDQVQNIGKLDLLIGKRFWKNFKLFEPFGAMGLVQSSPCLFPKRESSYKSSIKRSILTVDKTKRVQSIYNIQTLPNFPNPTNKISKTFKFFNRWTVVSPKIQKGTQ